MKTVHVVNVVFALTYHMGGCRTYAPHYSQRRRCSVWLWSVSWNWPRTMSTAIRSRNTTAQGPASQWPIMRTTVRTSVFATSQSDPLLNRSCRLFSVWPPLPDAASGTTILCVRKWIHGGHRVGRHRFPNTYDEHDDRAPTYMHHAGNSKKFLEFSCMKRMVNRWDSPVPKSWTRTLTAIAVAMLPCTPYATTVDERRPLYQSQNQRSELKLRSNEEKT